MQTMLGSKLTFALQAINVWNEVSPIAKSLFFPPDTAPWNEIKRADINPTYIDPSLNFLNFFAWYGFTVRPEYLRGLYREFGPSRSPAIALYDITEKVPAFYTFDEYISSEQSIKQIITQPWVPR